MIDYLIVGAGITGATIARQLTNAGKGCMVIDKREHVAGNCYDELIDGVRVHKHGGHAFHTNSRRVWDYVNHFAEWQHYEHRVKVSHNGTVYSFPPNRATYDQLGTDDPDVIRGMFFDGYTRKQWGDNPPPNVTKRIPFRTTYDDRYFADTYQGLPVGGYTALVERMLDGIIVCKGVDFLQMSLDWWQSRPQGWRIIYTGALDALYHFELGKLAYRSLLFSTETVTGDFQGCATMNYADFSVPYTRINEWKHWGWQDSEQTVITREYPASEGEPYYPVNDDANNILWHQYKALADASGIHVAGRLGSYKYLNMDQAIAQGLNLAERLLHEC